MLKVDKELCIGCGICEESCPFAAIEIVDGCAVIGESCNLCGACVETCEVEALSLEVEKIAKTDITAWSGVLVYCEYRLGELAPVSLELLGVGRLLADKRKVDLSAVLIGHDTGGTAAELIGYGADVVYRVDHEELECFTDERYCAVLTGLIREHQPEIVLAGATAIGRSFIPGVATTLDAGLTADSTQL